MTPCRPRPTVGARRRAGDPVRHRLTGAQLHCAGRGPRADRESAIPREAARVGDPQCARFPRATNGAGARIWWPRARDDEDESTGAGLHTGTKPNPHDDAAEQGTGNLQSAQGARGDRVRHCGARGQPVHLPRGQDADGRDHGGRTTGRRRRAGAQPGAVVARPDRAGRARALQARQGDLRRVARPRRARGSTRVGRAAHGRGTDRGNDARAAGCADTPCAHGKRPSGRSAR